LTDGVLPTSTSYGDSDWVVFFDTGTDDGVDQPQVTFDFGESHFFEQAEMTYLAKDTNPKFYPPDAVWVSVSEDGSTWTTPVEKPGPQDASGFEVRTAAFALNGMQGRYLRMDFRNGATWSALGEIAFTGSVTNSNASCFAPASYVYDGDSGDDGSQPYNSSDSGIELIDGIVTNDTAWGNAAWVLFFDPTADGDDETEQPQVTFDFLSTYAFEEAEITYLIRTSTPAFDPPDAVWASFSLDGSTWTTPVEKTGFGSRTNDEVRTTAIALGNTVGRYVRLKLLNDGAWAALGEIAFKGDLPPPTGTVISIR
jgi:hypothetical protein